MKCLIFGAGSVGAHHCFAARERNFEVVVVDPNPDALKRFETEIYPQRYGYFDEEVTLTTSRASLPQDYLEVATWVIGSPPDTHHTLLEEATKCNANLVLIEKPLSGPNDERFAAALNSAKARGIRILVGYNLLMSGAVSKARDIVKSEEFGPLRHINVAINESWQGILNAHPWLASANDSYLGFTNRGGGALYEHSHGVSLAVHFLKLAQPNRRISVSGAEMTFNGLYDEISTLLLSNGTISSVVVQDVLSSPPKKQIRLQCSSGLIVTTLNHKGTNDLVEVFDHQGLAKRIDFKKTRKDDFAVAWDEICVVFEGSKDKYEKT